MVTNEVTDGATNRGTNGVTNGVTFALNFVPFSLFGSYLSVSSLREGVQTPPTADALYLRTHHGGARAVMRLHATVAGEVVVVSLRASAEVVRLEHARGFIELCFDGAEALRIRGAGLGLRLEPLHPTVAYSADNGPNPQSVTLNMLATREQYRVSALTGRLRVHGLYQASGEARDPEVRLEVEQTSSALDSETDTQKNTRARTWEVSLHVFKSTFVPKKLVSFEALQDTNRSSFARWLDALPPVPSEYAQTRALAGYIMYSGVVAPSGLFKRPAMLMSKNWMDAVWSWDHLFNALALAPGHRDLAWDQLLLMADQQDEHGAYPDAYNSEHAVYNFAKPPVHGWATLELLKRSSPPEETLRRVYASLGRWTTWWLRHRVLPGETLPYYLHGNDSGWDNSTMFDRGVPLMTPDLSAYLILQMDALKELAERLNEPGGEAWARKAQRLYDALLDELWLEDRFVAKHANGETVYTESLLHHLPVVLAERLPEGVLNALAKNITAFVTDYGLATERPGSDHYRADGYWRGPVWAPSTYLVVRGLEASGFDALARTISLGFCKACAGSGFAENFDALTGEGLRDRAYTWTASVFLLLASGSAPHPEGARSV